MNSDAAAMTTVALPCDSRTQTSDWKQYKRSNAHQQQVSGEWFANTVVVVSDVFERFNSEFSFGLLVTVL